MQNLTLNDEEFQPERDVVAETLEQIITQWDICNLEFLIILFYLSPISLDSNWIYG